MTSNENNGSTKRIFTPAEAVFHQVLKEAIGDKFTISPKVKLSDVVDLNDSTTKAYAAGISSLDWDIIFNSNTKQHIDFALVDPDTLEFCKVIELDDTTHKNPHSTCLDYFKNFACHASGIPIYRFKQAASYDIQAIHEALSTPQLPQLTASEYSLSELKKHLSLHKHYRKNQKQSYNTKTISDKYNRADRFVKNSVLLKTFFPIMFLMACIYFSFTVSKYFFGPTIPGFKSAAKPKIIQQRVMPINQKDQSSLTDSGDSLDTFDTYDAATEPPSYLEENQFEIDSENDF